MVDRLIETQWGQNAPYNNYVDYYQNINNSLGSRDYIAGCGSVVAAQFIAYYGYISATNKQRTSW
ncbi:MAG: C10 family peptidase [Treponema sp.]|nr:C10 family peptidase [Treponema sp.]